MYSYEVTDILNKLTYKGKKNFWKFTPIESDKGLLFDLLVRIDVKDRISGKKTGIYKHHVFQQDEIKMMTETRILRTVKELLYLLETHEIDEQLIYGDMRVFDPHQVLYGTNVINEKEREEKRLQEVKAQVIQQLNEHKAQESEAQK